MRGAATGAGLRTALRDPGNHAWRAYYPSDWAWEFLRRHQDYRTDWRVATPRSPPRVLLRDGTLLIRLRRRYPRAERWGLYAFADPSHPTGTTPVFWLPTVSRRIVRARCDMGTDLPHAVTLAQFRAERFAMIGSDGAPVVAFRGGCSAGLVAPGWHVLTRPAAVTFELDGFNGFSAQIEGLRLLQRLTLPVPLAPVARPAVKANERLFHALTALDGSLAGRSYREIATTIFGQHRVARDWNAASRFLKDRTRRLVARGHALMNGGYRDLLS